MNNKSKYVILGLCLFCLGTFTFLNTNKNNDEKIVNTNNSSYLAELIASDETELTSQLSTAQSGDTVLLNNNLTLTSDLEIPSGVKLVIASDVTLTVPAEISISSLGEIEISTGAKLDVIGRAELIVESSVHLYGTLKFEEGSNFSTGVTLEAGSYLNIYAYDGSTIDIPTSLNLTSDVAIYDYGTTYTNKLSGSVQIHSFFIYDETNRMFYENFIDIPASNVVKVTKSLNISSDTIPTNVTVVVPTDVILTSESALTVNGLLKVDGGEISLEAVDGNGTIKLPLGKYNSESYQTEYYAEFGDISNTITIDTTAEEVQFKDVLYKIKTDERTQADIIANTPKYSSKFEGISKNIREVYVNTTFDEDLQEDVDNYNYFVTATYQDIPDEKLYTCIQKSYWELNNDTEFPEDYKKILTTEELKTITTLDCEGDKNNPFGVVHGLVGIDKLVNLKEINLKNNDLPIVDLTQNKLIEKVNVSNSNVEYLYLTDLDKLETLDASDNNITELNLDSNQALKELDLSNNYLSNINVLNNTLLTKLNLENNELYSIDLILNDSLEELKLSKNNLLNLDLSANMNLKTLLVNDNSLIMIMINTIDTLTTLDVSNNNLESIDLSGNTNLETLKISNNNLNSLNVSNLSKLVSVDAKLNKLTSFKANGCSSLKTIDISKDEDEYSQINNLSLTGLTALERFDASNANINNITLSGLSNLETIVMDHNNLTTFITTGLSKIKNLDLSDNELTSINLSGAGTLETLNLDNNSILNINSSSMPHIKGLSISNNNISSLNLSENADLIVVNASNNKLESINLSNLASLKNLDLSNNLLDSITLTDLVALKELNLANNLIEEIDFSNNKVVGKVNLNNNNLTSLDLTDTTKLTSIDIEGNNFNTSMNTTLNAVIDITTLTDPVKLPLTGISIDELDLDETRVFASNIKDIGVSEGLSVEGNNVTVDEKGTHTITITRKYTKEALNDYEEVSYEYVTTYTLIVPYITSEVYEINEDENYIYVKSSSIDENIMNNITTSAGYASYNTETNKVELRYDETDEAALKTYDVINFELETLQVMNNNIIISEEKTIQNLIDDVKSNVEIKVYESILVTEEPVEYERTLIEDTTKVLTPGMEVDVYIGESKKETYTVTNDYIEINNLNIDETNNLIKIENIGDTLDSVLSNIDTNGNITVYTSDGELIEDTTNVTLKTGMDIKIELSQATYEYKVSVKGDVTGSGASTISDAMRIISYVLDSNEFANQSYYIAADLNNDGNISVSDVMKLINDILS